MTIFNQTHWSTLITTALCMMATAHADVIELADHDILTGTINKLDHDEVTINSALTTQPLQIKVDKIRSITFDSEESTPRKHTEQVTLTNGDTLPCSVTSLDQNALHISTWFAGKFSIPRTSLRSLQFGVVENQTIYQGHDDLSEWPSREGRWSYSEKGYSCRGIGTLARPLELPQNLQIRFDLSWKETPIFAFRFCAENDKATTRQNTYELTFNSAGLKISRCKKNQRQIPLATIALKPHEIKDHKINIDLRINREIGKITLFLDGKQRGAYIDTFDATQGNHIILNNRSNQGDGFHIDNFEVNQWRNGTLATPHLKLTQGADDILIDSEGERISGQLESIFTAEDQYRVVQLKVKHTPKPLRVPGRRINTLIFARQDDPPKKTTANFTAELIGGGSLQLTAPQLTGGKITSQHHILGSCTIDTSVVSRIVKTPPSE